MASTNDRSWLFVAEWFDPLPQLKKKYLLKFFVDQLAVEMVDVKTKKLFLKKTKLPPEIAESDFFVGAKVNIFSRELEIVDYGDLKTRDLLQHQNQVVTFLLPSGLYRHWGHFLDHLVTDKGFTVSRINTFLISSNALDALADNMPGTSLDNGPSAKAAFRAGVNLMVVAHAEDGYRVAQQEISKEVGRWAGAQAETMVISSSSSQSNAMQELLVGQKGMASTQTATMDSCTCCIIKPHAFKSRLFGKIIDQIIAQGYEISAMKTLIFDRTQAAEFLEVYDGVVPEYPDHINQLSNGVCVALEIRCEDAVKTFRVTCGPWDVGMAKELYPDTIRGQFGLDRIRSAVHCTDLPQDGPLECEYCFKILS